AKATYLRDALDYIQNVADESGEPVNASHQPGWARFRNGNFQPAAPAKGEFGKAPIAVNLTLIEDGQPNAVGVPQRKCTLCGDCVTGCNVGAKNVLTMNYLPLARQHGATIFSQVEVQSIHPSDRADYRYGVIVLVREPKDGKLQKRQLVVYTNMLVLSAGVLGTAKLLFNAQQRGEMVFSAQLGQRFSGNADALAVSYNGQRQLNSIGYGRHGQASWEVGPTITAMADFRRAPGRHHLVQDAAFPSPLVKSIGRLFAAPNFWKVDPRVWRDLLAPDVTAKAKGALNHSQVWLSMGHDAAAGELRCDARGNLRLSWLGSGAQQVHVATRKTFQILSQIVGASHIANPRDRSWFIKRTSTPITVHPLGGCCMADDIEHGVTDHAGRVYHPERGIYDGFYISDGSLCDASVGANPSLTIAALAERAAEQIITQDLPRLFGGQHAASAGPSEGQRVAPRNSTSASKRRQPQPTTTQTLAPLSTSFLAEGGRFPARSTPVKASKDVQFPRRNFSRAHWLTVIEILLLALVLNVAIRISSAAQPSIADAPLGQPIIMTTDNRVVPGLQVGFLPVDSIKPNSPGQMRIGILSPTVPAKADILFIHGHADRLDNHGALFGAWAEAGYRVLAFDLPSHGESN
ncbi:MAG: hypothetical protein KDE46_15290, partial [Caldilineaceae bacterium]|nr:hypothetical protein [Caldilineaceae bacterium]